MEHRELLELLYSARNQFTNIQVTWQYWYRADMMQELRLKWYAQHPRGSVTSLTPVSGAGIQDRTEAKVNWRVWWQKPSRWRDERRLEGQGTMITIRCEDKWWLFSSANRKLHTNVLPETEQSHFHIRKSDQSPVPALEDLVKNVPLLDPSFLLATHDLQPRDSILHAEREVVRVQAMPRRDREVSWDPFFWASADAYDLLVDKERGILLRYAAKLGDQEFAVASVDKVTFDEPIAKEVFSFTPPPDTSVELAS